MKKLFKILLVMFIAITSTPIQEACALENLSKNENEISESEPITPKSGGLVSTSYSTPTYSLVSEANEYIWLTTAWAPASEYEIEKTVTVSTSVTTTAGATTTLPSSVQKSLEVSISFGASVSATVNTHIPANASKKSKLRLVVRKNKYLVKYNLVAKYYDTSVGYYTTTTPYERYVTIPQEDESYIEVVYQ